MVKVERLRPPLTEADVARIARIYAGYSPAPVTQQSITAAVNANPVFVARDEGTIVGFVTLVVYPRMKGLVSHIEDIVVAADHRRQGVAETLWKACCEHARREGCLQVGLMTYPNLEAANRFYRNLGLEEHQVNSYRQVL